jgi:hypothetical protein
LRARWTSALLCALVYPSCGTAWLLRACPFVGFVARRTTSACSSANTVGEKALPLLRDFDLRA